MGLWCRLLNVDKSCRRLNAVEVGSIEDLVASVENEHGPMTH